MGFAFGSAPHQLAAMKAQHSLTTSSSKDLRNDCDKSSDQHPILHMHRSFVGVAEHLRFFVSLSVAHSHVPLVRPHPLRDFGTQPAGGLHAACR